MTPTNCPRCGKLFAKVTEPICPNCVKEEEQIFENVRDYIKENPDKNIKEVAEECNVTTKRILQYIRDGRIDSSAGMHGDILCSKCGKPIVVGRMCEKCVLETNFKVADMKAQKKSSGMHVGRR